jgi:hypothetical protein
MESFLPAQEANPPTQSSNQVDLNDLIISPVEYSASIHNSFIEALTQHISCTCSLSDYGPASTGHWTRLKLLPNVSVVQGEILFDTLFSATPVGISEIFTNWQHLRFHVPRYDSPSLLWYEN